MSATFAWRFKQGFHFFATQNHRQSSFAPRKRDVLDGDLPAERVGIEEAQRANHLDVGGQRHLFLFHEEKLVLANVFRTKLVGWFVEVMSELGDRVQVNANGGGRVMADLQILQHALAKWGHKKAPFVVTPPQIASPNQSRWVYVMARTAGGLVQ